MDGKLLYNDEKDNIIPEVNDRAKKSRKEILKKMSKKRMTKKLKERKNTTYGSFLQQHFTDVQVFILIF